MTGPGYDLPNVPWVMYFTHRGHSFTPKGARVVVHY